GHAETTGGAGDGRAFGKHELDGGLAELTVVLARFGNALCDVSRSLRQAGAYRSPVSTGGGQVQWHSTVDRIDLPLLLTLPELSPRPKAIVDIGLHHRSTQTRFQRT
ncbi:MAG: hypothetical protein SGJ09_17510, partial [Phycisphaerae bacterium]|nr:hypothetical protein [Phycisphaerae bacterium]MDZ4831977.1 hypothetical protein [Phycisphaerae bacterium]